MLRLRKLLLLMLSSKLFLELYLVWIGQLFAMLDEAVCNGGFQAWFYVSIVELFEGIHNVVIIEVIATWYFCFCFCFCFFEIHMFVELQGVADRVCLSLLSTSEGSLVTVARALRYFFLIILQFIPLEFCLSSCRGNWMSDSSHNHSVNLLVQHLSHMEALWRSSDAKIDKAQPSIEIRVYGCFY